MGQIVRRKKKGRPSKADLARRAIAEQPETAADRDLRRSLRRRNVRYNFDFDEYIEDEDEDEVDDDDDDDDEDTRREKKLKLVLKLQNKDEEEDGGGADESRRVAHAPESSSDCDDDDGGGKPPTKKRKIDGGGDEIEGDVDDDEIEENDDEEAIGRKIDAKPADSVPGTPSEPLRGFQLPDKKSVELILDKLQKKDTYGVYAEPVDPEELPDYHEVIQNPMDFATVRKKLANGLYTTLDQFETDVLLICSNAMQYNAPDTIYHKQARSIQELAKKKFERMRIDAERSDKDLKSEQNSRFGTVAKKQIKKPIIGRTLQEPIGSDFYSGATLATTGDVQHGLNVTQAGGYERPANLFGIVEGHSSLIDGNLEKAEDFLSGKGILSKIGRKPVVVHEENRRATYNTSNHESTESESIYTTFDSEIKQLTAVGLHTDHSYARSLARFAATLGPVPWKVASRRIEQSLPPGIKFGRGWVGEYEPLPTPVLKLETCPKKEPDFYKQSSTTTTSDARNNDGNTKTRVTGREHINNNGPSSPVVHSTSSPKEKQSFFSSAGPSSRDPELKKMVSKQAELDRSPQSRQSSAEFVAEKKILKSGSSLKQPRSSSSGVSNGEVVSLDRNNVVPNPNPNPNQMFRAANFFPHGQDQQQGLSDPVQLMRMFSENNSQKQQKSVDSVPITTPPSRRDDSSNAAAVAARAWMSIGAGGVYRPPSVENNRISGDSLYNNAAIREQLQPQISRFRGEFPVPGVQLQHEKNVSPLQTFLAPPPGVRVGGNEAQHQNRPVVFPQFVTADLSRFHMQSPRQGYNPLTQSRPKPESLPPDLNIGFQSSGSPVRQASGVVVDSQQPDLALQL